MLRTSYELLKMIGSGDEPKDLAVFQDVTWIVVSVILAGLGNAFYDPASSAYILDITPPEHKAWVMGLKGTVGSLGNMLGPAWVVLIAPLVGPQIAFLISAALVLMLAYTSGLDYLCHSIILQTGKPHLSFLP